MTDTIPPLDGAADPNAWHFSADHGPLPNPVGHTFPLLSHDSDGRWRLIGTGFYISKDGLFITAKHVIEDVLDREKQISPLAIFHFRSSSGSLGAQEYLIRPIMQCWLGEKADIALGVAVNATNKITGQTLLHWHWRLSWNITTIGMRVGLYAYPNKAIHQDGEYQTITFRPDAYFGNIQEVEEYRDSVMIPHPYLQSDIRSYGGASGGPIFGSDGTVVGVNCRWLEPEGPGFGVQIQCLQGAFIDDAILAGEQVPRRVTFTELVSAGIVDVTGFTTASTNTHAGRLVRLDTVPITARGPNIKTILSA
jgi:hypothetical protein